MESDQPYSYQTLVIISSLNKYLQLQVNLLICLDLPKFSYLINGSTPLSIGQLVSLSFLCLNGNMLNGPLPPTLNHLSKLTELFNGINPFRTLRLENNQLIGTLPPSICNLTSLQDLHLSLNQPSGFLPIGLGNNFILTTSLVQLCCLQAILRVQNIILTCQATISMETQLWRLITFLGSLFRPLSQLHCWGKYLPNFPTS